MILKISDLHKNLENPNNFYLFHGSNTGQIEEIIENIFKPKLSKNIYNYYESDVIDKIEEFKENILNKSFFDDDKLIIINRGTDKITGIIENLIFKKITNVTIVIKSDILEKKSKLRILFEKNRETICIPFYDDNQKVLFSIAQSFFLKHKIKISSQNVNYIIEKSKNDRVNLKNELQKLFLFYKGNSIIEYKDIIKLIKSNKDHNLSDYADHFLVKDKKKLIKILNENSFVIDDNIILIKSILFKLKRLKN
jgi:DNA polymerase-3 subunit delta